MQLFLACILHTAALNVHVDSCPLEVKPRPMQTIYSAIARLHSAQR